MQLYDKIHVIFFSFIDNFAFDCGHFYHGYIFLDSTLCTGSNRNYVMAKPNQITTTILPVNSYITRSTKQTFYYSVPNVTDITDC